MGSDRRDVYAGVLQPLELLRLWIYFTYSSVHRTYRGARTPYSSCEYVCIVRRTAGLDADREVTLYWLSRLDLSFMQAQLDDRLSPLTYDHTFFVLSSLRLKMKAFRASITIKSEENIIQVLG